MGSAVVAQQYVNGGRKGVRLDVLYFHLFVYLLEQLNSSPVAVLSVYCSMHLQWGYQRYLLSLEVLSSFSFSLVASVAFPIAFIYLCLLCCNMLSANVSQVVDCGYEHTLQCPLIFVYLSSDYRCCGQGPPVPKLGIRNKTLRKEWYEARYLERVRRLAWEAIWLNR